MIDDSKCDYSVYNQSFVRRSHYINKKPQHLNTKLCDVRNAFEKYNLISGIHTFLSTKDKIYENLIPPLHLLNGDEKKDLLLTLDKLEFSIKNLRAA